jgi:ABC-type taurine transport system ATPase subunit
VQILLDQVMQELALHLERHTRPHVFRKTLKLEQAVRHEVVVNLGGQGRLAKPYKQDQGYEHRKNEQNKRDHHEEQHDEEHSSKSATTCTRARVPPPASEREHHYVHQEDSRCL